MNDERSGRFSERALAGRFRRGDPAAFDTIVRQHREIVYRVAWRVLRRHGDADEAAQVAFVRAWQGRARFRGDAAIRTWLVRIALNVARTMLASRRPEGPQVDDVVPVAPGPPSDEALTLAEGRSAVRAAVATLPPRQREVVELKVFSEMTHREVAEVLELSEGAVKAHLHQAVANLRKRLASRLGNAPGGARCEERAG